MSLFLIHLRRAWAGLWAGAPSALLSQALPLADFDPIPLADRSQWGRIGLALQKSQITGLQTAIPALPPMPTGANGRFAAQLTLPTLTVTGAYTIQTTQTNSPSVPFAVADDNADPNSMDLARQQRTRLNSTANGRQLVTLYYQHNEILNGLFQNENVQATWQTYKTNNQNTKYYMDHTYNALLPENISTTPVDRTPDDQTTYGPTQYQLHGFYMALYMQGVCNRMHDHLQKSDLDTALRYQNAADDIGATIQKTYTNNLAPQSSQGAQITNTGAHVYAQVEGANGGVEAATVGTMPEPDYLHALRQQAQADLAKSGFTPTALLRARNPSWVTALTGAYTVTLTNVPVTLSGTASLTENGQYTVTITQVTAQLPPLALQLSDQPGDALFADVQQLLAPTGFVNQMIASRISQRFDESDVHTVFANLFNAALAEGA